MLGELTYLLSVFVGLAAVIVVAGTFLSEYADVLAERTGVGHTLGGLLLLASATSLPELAVDCKAAMIGQPDIAIGAVLGSSIFNLLILGCLDILLIRGATVFSPASSSHVLPAVTTILLSSVVVGFVAMKELPVEFALGTWTQVGLGTVLTIVFYMYCLRLIYLDQQRRQHHSVDPEEATDGSAEDSDSSGVSTARAVFGYSLSTIVILFAAGYMAPTADRLAEITNLGGTFIGSTLIALTTSLPELVTTWAAMRMGAHDMAVGNILGSNAFNMAILFPVDLFYRTGSGSLLKDAEIAHAITGSTVIIVTAVMLLTLMYKPSGTRRVWDPGAGLVVILAATAFVALYFLTPAAL